MIIQCYIKAYANNYSTLVIKTVQTISKIDYDYEQPLWYQWFRRYYLSDSNKECTH